MSRRYRGLSARVQKEKRRIQRCASVQPPLTLAIEIHLDLRELIDGLSIELGGFESPLFNRVESCVAEHSRSADELRVGDFAIFGDSNLNFHNSVGATNFRDRRVYRSNFLEHLHRLKVRLLNAYGRRTLRGFRQSVQPC